MTLLWTLLRIDHYFITHTQSHIWSQKKEKKKITKLFLLFQGTICEEWQRKMCDSEGHSKSVQVEMVSNAFKHKLQRFINATKWNAMKYAIKEELFGWWTHQISNKINWFECCHIMYHHLIHVFFSRSIFTNSPFR